MAGLHPTAEPDAADHADEAAAAPAGTATAARAARLGPPARVALLALASLGAYAWWWAARIAPRALGGDVLAATAGARARWGGAALLGGLLVLVIAAGLVGLDAVAAARAAAIAEARGAPVPPAAGSPWTAMLMVQGGLLLLAAVALLVASLRALWAALDARERDLGLPPDPPGQATVHVALCVVPGVSLLGLPLVLARTQARLDRLAGGAASTARGGGRRGRQSG